VLLVLVLVLVVVVVNVARTASIFIKASSIDMLAVIPIIGRSGPTYRTHSAFVKVAHVGQTSAVRMVCKVNNL